jgi:exopolysaccharide transport family protein
MTIQRRSTAFQNSTAEREGTIEDLPAINFSDFLRVLHTHKLIVFGTAVVVFALAALTVAILTPLYSPSALVLLDQKHNPATDPNAVIPIPSLISDATTIQNQIQILESRALAARVVDKLKLVDDPEFNPPPDAPPRNAQEWIAAQVKNVRNFYTHSWLNPSNWFGDNTAAPTAPASPDDVKNAVINRFLNNLNVNQVGSSATLTVSFASQDAAKSARITNAVADAYVEDQLNAKFEATQKASQWLSDRLRQVAVQTQASDRAVEQYKAANNLTDTVIAGTPAGTSLVQQQLSALNMQLVNAQADLAVQEAKYNQVMDLQRSGRAADVSQVVGSSLISQLRQQETDVLRQEAELSSRYGPRHPKVLDMESQKQNLAAKIDEEVRRVVETVANDVEVARVRVRSLQQSLAKTTGQTQTENFARVKLSELTATATSNRTLYDALLTQFKNIEDKDAVQAPDARVISPATTPTQPSFPKKLLFLGGAIPGGLILGVLFAVLSASFETGFRTREDVERELALPVLAALPELPGRLRRGSRATELVVRKPTSSFAEAVRGLHLGLALSNSDKPPKTIVITSALPSEGKTTVAINLARIAARVGQRVILVDADLRRPSVHRAINASSSVNGLADVLSGRLLLEDCLMKDPGSDVLFLPASGRTNNPAELLASEEMANLLEKLAAACDLLIIDSPPLLPVNDARILARLADAVVLVVRWERTPRAASLHAIRSLTDSMAPLAGVVLARADKGQFRYENYGKRRFRNFDRYYQ